MTFSVYQRPIYEQRTSATINNIVTYIKGNGSIGSINIVDSSLSPKIVTRTGNVTISNLIRRIGDTSILVTPGGSWFRVGVNTNPIGLGNYTLEFWCYPTKTSGSALCGFRSHPTSLGTKFGLDNFNSGSVRVFLNGISLDGTFSLGSGNTWIHFAIVRNNGMTTIYRNGSSVYSSSTTYNLDSADELYMGLAHDTSNTFGGNFENIILSNIAKYTSNFDPNSEIEITGYSDTNIMQDLGGNNFLGDCRWANSDILFPNTSYLQSRKITNNDINGDLSHLLMGFGSLGNVTGNWGGGSELFLSFTPPIDNSAPSSFRFSMSPATSGNTRSLALARNSSGTTVIGGDALDINEEQFWTSNDESSPIFERQITAMVGKNSVGIFLLRRKTNATSIIPLFMYCGVLEDVNPNLNYYTGSFERSFIVIIWGYSQGTSTPVLYVRHLAGTTARSPLLTLDAVYPIACEDNSIPNSQWATDFFIFDDSPALGYPRVGKVANMLLSTSPNLTIGKPVYVNGSVITDGGSRWFIPVGYFGGRTMLMRCYSSVEKD